MAEKTLQEALGVNATQTSTTITLNKSDLALTATTCTADQVIAAINIKAKPVLTQDNFAAESEQKIYLTDGFASTTTKTNSDTIYLVKQIVVNLAKADAQQTLDPNDY